MLDALIWIVGGIAAFAVALLVFYFVMSLFGEGGRIVAFVFPGVALLFAGLLIPALVGVVSSMQNDTINFETGKRRFVGLRYYGEIATSNESRSVLLNSALWVIVGTLFSTGIGLIIARFADGMKGEKTVKSLIFLPIAISLAGAGITWKFVYQGGDQLKIGLLNSLTGAIPGLPDRFGGAGNHLWLTETKYGGIPRANTLLLIVIFIWIQTGLATVMLSAAVKGVPESLVEAAKVDGATNRQAFFRVTIPYIRATIVTVMTLNVIAGLKAFDIVAATTGGNASTSTIANEFYRTYFVQDRAGYASAFAVVLFILVIPFLVISRRVQSRAEAQLF